MSSRGAAKYIPALAFGHKIYPEHLASALGLAAIGDIWYVDPANGNDTANNGKSLDDAFATVAAAHSAATADQDDVVVIASTGSSSGRTAETDNVTWSKRRTHLVGNGAPRRINNRNGVGTDSTLTGETTTAIFTVTGNNCIFSNLSFATFQDNNVLVEVQSDYNTFMNVHFQGIGHDDTGDDANARSLYINGSEENEFINCTIGLDTVTRSGVQNASVELAGVSARNKFINCDFPIFADAGNPVFVLFDGNDSGQRWTKFENCFFHSPILASSTAITDGMIVPSALNGTVILDNCWSYGVTDIADDYTNVFVNNNVVATTDPTFMIVGAAG